MPGTLGYKEVVYGDGYVHKQASKLFGGRRRAVDTGRGAECAQRVEALPEAGWRGNESEDRGHCHVPARAAGGLELTDTAVITASLP